MNYKKLVKSQGARFAILKALSFIPDTVMLRLQYRIKVGFWPNFKNPKRYTEKIQLYKMRYRNPLMPICVDKYEVREFVRQKGLESILNTLYGVYDRAEMIDFSTLPGQFVIKTTDGGGGNNILLCKNKSKLDIPKEINRINSWLNVKDANPGREWAYTGIKKSRIIVEELLQDDSNADGSVEDYKLMCFNGTFGLLWVDKNRYSDHHRGFWDKDLNFLPNVSSDHDTFKTPPPLPENISEMIKIAERLSEDFPYARVDLYNIKGKIVFGEITFYPWSGYVKFNPDSFDFQLGEMLAL